MALAELPEGGGRGLWRLYIEAEARGGRMLTMCRLPGGSVGDRGLGISSAGGIPLRQLHAIDPGSGTV